MFEPSHFRITSSCSMHFYQQCLTKLTVMCLSTLCLFFFNSWNFFFCQSSSAAEKTGILWRILFLPKSRKSMDWFQLGCWSSKTLATWCEELTHWKRPWCWERLRTGGEGDDRGWDGWMASPTGWAWVWASSRSWWWTGKPGVLQSTGSQRVGHNWGSERSTISREPDNLRTW